MKLSIPHLSNFTLLTESAYNLQPSISRTYTTEGHFSSGLLSSNSKAEGFIIFNTKEPPKTLSYKDPFGNEISINLP
ncbi:hypothetical protein KKG61_01725 [bacterium]|nr:hypothetical protein [bacterium]MBU1598819.1 hypothetical protein [bacterium]